METKHTAESEEDALSHVEDSISLGSKQKTMWLVVSRVDKAVFDGPVLAVSVPGSQGAMQILANHEAFISPLAKGTISIIKSDGTKESHVILRGTVEVSNNRTTILI